MERSNLIRVFNYVIRDIENGYYIFDQGGLTEYSEVQFEDIKKLKRGTKMYDEIGKIENYKIPHYYHTRIYCKNIDSFEKAIEMGEDCAVLNMASARSAGGGVTNGSRAQEEELCRRSNLIYSLYSFTPKGKELFSFDNTAKNQYPIPTFGGIYSPKVNIYRKPKTYETMESPKLCNVISVSGVIRPRIDEVTGMMANGFPRMVKRKIRQIFRIAILNHHSKLVLGAFGCGAFKNPPKHVALLFEEVLNEPEFKNSFEEICFAILEDNNSRREHNPEGNLKPFVERFGL